MRATRDLPQASSLPKVRALVAAVAAGHDRTLHEAGAAVGLSPRHADYYGLAATTTLGLVESGPERLTTTALGRALLATSAHTAAERDVFRRAIDESTAVTSIAPDLLAADGPTAEALTHRLIHAGLSAATARRRASTLLAWRRYVLERQTTLELVVDHDSPIRRSRAAR